MGDDKVTPPKEDVDQGAQNQPNDSRANENMKLSNVDKQKIEIE